MPLVRIDVQSGRTPAELRRLADVVQEVMLDVFAAPPRDRYQIITEHPVGHIIAEDTGLGLERTDGVTSCRSCSRGDVGAEEGGLRAAGRAAGRRVRGGPGDLIVSVTANERADWSFGLGRAQFLEGEL